VATNFPSSQDNFVNPTSSDTLDSPDHAAQHSNVNDAVEAIELALLDGAPLFIDDTNERVGIGTTSPATALEVAGAAAHIRITDSDTAGTTGIDFYDSNGTADVELEVGNSTQYFAIKTAGSEAMRIDSSGNVGIGTTSPQRLLDIRGASNPEIRMQSTDSSNPAIYFGDQVDAVRGGIRYDTANDRLEVQGYNNNTRIAVDSSGNVGIGTTSPATALDVAIGGANFNGYVTVNSYLSVSRAGGSGNSLVVQNSSPVGAGVVRGMQVELGPDGNEDYTDSGDDFIRFITSNNQEIGGIRGTGAASVSYGTTSDYRLKAPIEEISDGLSLVRNLAPMYGKWLNQNDPDRIYSYFVAHELQEHIPDAVDGVKDAVDEEGEPDYQSVDYGKLTPVLTAAIKELDGLVQTLTARIEALEAG
jgi:hypothetical protein